MGKGHEKNEIDTYAAAFGLRREAMRQRRVSEVSDASKWGLHHIESE